MIDIGVVTPTHPSRNQKYLKQASQSVWSQSLPPRGHFIVNDLAGDGAARTRQAALESNPFEWTAFLDSDDWFNFDHLQKLAEAAMDTGADYIYSWYWLARQHGETTISTDKDPVFPPGHFLNAWDPKNPRQTTITVLVKTELAREVGFVDHNDKFPDGQKQGEDWQFTLGCNKLGTIYHLVDRTWFWRHHGLNSSGLPGKGDA